ncbi:MAG TPA: allantoinase AllB [Acidimicrobiia bacterium]|nr:allantoinase AllB [Acidimicrobiia bacterium]
MPKLRSNRVVLPEGERPATIRYEDGRIVDVGDGPADHDFGDFVILPGLVDCHVHVNEPGRTEWEGFATASAAALAGGTTTLVDMPLNSIPPTVDVAALEEKRAAARTQVHADVAFWAGIIPDSTPNVAGLVEAGVCGFKVFTVDSGVEEFPPLSPPLLARAAGKVASTGVPLLVHAEEPSHLREPSGDPRAYVTYLVSRPAIAEAVAIDTVADLVRSRGVQAHILHVAGAEAVAAVDRSAGALSAETCPHYLTFDAASIPEGATAFKCAPPIRTAEDRESLWEALASGVLNMVVSDHSPAPPEVKELDSGNFLRAWGGIASLELRLPATWHGAHLRGFGTSELALWLASAPSDLAGLTHRKGRIAEGMDADFVVFDPDGETHVEARRLRQRHPVTPYDGMRLRGAVVATFLRGTRNDDVFSEPRGELLRRGA